MSNPVVTARLEIIAAKAKILAEKYKNNQLWDGELSEGLREITYEISRINTENGSSERGGWGDR